MDLANPTTLPESADLPRPDHRIATLDGLRGIAILAVFCAHMIPQDILWPTKFLEWPRKFLLAGWIGVDLFFVLSGFLITGILLRAKGRPGYFRNFYMRRVLRIFPLYYAALAVVFFVLPALRLVNWKSFEALWDNQAWLWFYSSNFGMFIKGRNAFQSDQIGLLHFWSLSVEKHFYLIWPALVLLTSPRALRWVCGGCVLAALVIRCVAFEFYHPHIYFLVLTPCRIDALATGAWLASMASESRLRTLLPAARAAVVIGLMFLIVDIFIRKGLWNGDLLIETIGLTVIALTAGGAIVIAVHLHEQGRSAKLLGGPVLGFFGKYSYGMYVIHGMCGPALLALLPAATWVTVMHSQFGGSVAVFFYQACVATVLAVASWHLYEKHFLKLKRYFEYGSTHKVKGPA